MSWPYSTLYLLAGALLCSVAHGVTGKYELRVDEDSPTTATIRLVLDAPLRSEHRFFARGFSEASRDLKPRCEASAQELLVTDDGWIAPVGCEVIKWEVAFRATVEASTDVSEQVNLHYPNKWWLFTEWGELLRPAEAETPLLFCFDVRGESSCMAVPTVEEPPLFALLGKPDEQVDLDGTTFRFFVGHLPQTLDVRELYNAYRAQISYLRSIAPGGDGQYGGPDELDVLILGIDASHGTVGGAAGHSAYLANVAIDGDSVTAIEMTRLLWLSGHELVHLLGIDGGPIWASEGLAHYYGHKSLGQTMNAKELFQEMLEHAPQVGLLEGYRRYTHGGERRYQVLFYSKGAEFWKAIDSLLVESTGGSVDLDKFLPILRGMPFGDAGELPQPFLDAVLEYVDETELTQVLDQFL